MHVQMQMLIQTKTRMGKQTQNQLQMQTRAHIRTQSVNQMRKLVHKRESSANTKPMICNLEFDTLKPIDNEV